MTTLDVDRVVLTGQAGSTRPTPYVVVPAEAADLVAYHRLRTRVFVHEQGLFSSGTHRERDEVDEDPRCRVLVARAPDGAVLGGVRLHPVRTDLAGPASTGVPGERDLGWWRGSRLVVAPGARVHLGVGAALVRAACAAAEDAGALRFDASVQAGHAGLFGRLGWVVRSEVELHGLAHLEVHWPIGRVQRLVDATKSALGGLLGELTTGPHGGGGAGFVGDDGAPVPGTDVVAACDAILPSMVERDPEWAGWCAVLVNLNDLAAMGATPVGLLDAVGARDASFARRILRGLVDASRAWGVPVLGGHTQLGVPGSLSVTALGRTTPSGLPGPVPGGGGRPGQALRVTADVGGGWRPGHTGSQWDSSSHRTPAQLRALGGVVPALRPTAAKDVSMTGIVGTAGMLAEAGGCRAVLDVAAVPSPVGVTAGDWLTCFPGFAMVTAEADDAPGLPAALPTTVPATLLATLLGGDLVSHRCGELTAGTGVGLRWPDGMVTEAVAASVTGMGVA